MVINHPKKGGQWWFSVLLGHKGRGGPGNGRRGNGGKWGEMGEKGEEWAKGGDTWVGMKGLRAVHGSPFIVLCLCSHGACAPIQRGFW